MLLLAVALLISTATGPVSANKADGSFDLAVLGHYMHPTHTHVSVLDPDGVVTVYWTPGTHAVTWEIHARTLGWFGFGFSHNGGMTGADMITAWVVDGRLFLQDRHGVGETTPPQDDRADWRPLHARENDTHTVLVVSRDINTCDDQDFVLTNETVRLIYAWGDTDPLGDTPSYHGPRRGNRFALALLPFHRDIPVTDSLAPDRKTWEVRQNVTLPPGRHTYYWCHVEKVPEWKRKHHYIGFDMLYGPNARKHLHHAVAFECLSQDGQKGEDIFEQFVGHEGHECYTPNMPPAFYKCERFLINWAIGSEGELLPDHVGYPLGELHGGATYVLFQTHYDNKPMYNDLTVEWGMDIYYTDKVRKYDAGNIGLGHSLLFSLAVPPKVSYWKVAGHCDALCTESALPEEGVSVFMAFLHGHYLARAIRLRHFRGNQELQPIAIDSYFDADFQQSRRLTKEVRLLPGDHLTVECDYDSRQKANATFSGWAAVDEMCQAFINYYPRVDMALCRSSPHPDLVTDTFGLPPFSGPIDLNSFEFDPQIEGGASYQTTMQRLPWENVDIATANTKLLSGKQVIKCQYNYGRSMKLSSNITGYPKARSFIIPPDERCLTTGSDRPTHVQLNEKMQYDTSGGRGTEGGSYQFFSLVLAVTARQFL